MNTNRSIIKATLAGLLLAAAGPLTSSWASVADHECVSTCRQMRSAGKLECVAESNCAMEAKMARAYCIALTIRGPERTTCLTEVKHRRAECRSEVKACKTECNVEFSSCRSGCAS
jgi:hypothetical protein